MRSNGEARWLPTPPPLAGLPLRLTRVIGREAVVDALDATLDRHRLVTVVGPGGIGKSTVALATAERCTARYSGGARFMDLAHCREDADVLPYIAGALDLTAGKADKEAIATALGSRSILLVLDNCEHVIEAVAQLANQIAMAAPGVGLLATSREGLRIPGERIYRLPSLEVPPQAEVISAAEACEYSAIALFAERAAAVNAQFRLTDAEVPAAIDICRQLDGIPLAIELAAARVDTLGLAELAARLDDRFSLLTNGRRTALARHQTLEATLDWSYETLSETERASLACLSAFRGGFSLTSATSVATTAGSTTGQITQTVADLVSKSLLAVLPGQHGVRYRMLETTRQYGWRKLAERPDRNSVLRRHAATCLGLLGNARDDLLKLRRELWMRQYGALVADIQSAIEWAFSAEGDPSLGTALMIGAAPLGEQLVLPREYFQRLEEVVDRGAGSALPDPEIAKLGHPLAHIRIQLRGDLRLGEATVQRMAGTNQSGERVPEIAAAEFGAALLSGRYPDALRIAGEIETLAMARDDAALKMLAARCGAQANYFMGNFDEATALARRVLDSAFEYLPHSMNNHRISMRVILGCCAAIRADFQEALSLVREAIRLGRQDNPLTLCLALGMGGIPIAIWSGEEEQARDWLSEARRIADRSAAAFWGWTIDELARGIDIASEEKGAWHAGSQVEDRIGPMVFDMLPTFAPRLVNQRALERVRSGTVGWNAAEVLRADAMQVAPRACDEAMVQLYEAAALARRQQASLWQTRIDTSLAQLASTSES